MAKISLKENTTEILAISSTLFSFIFLMTLCFKEVPKGNEHLIDIMGGAIILTAIASVYGYYFGQSKKRETIPDPNTIISTTTKTEEIK